MTPIDMECSIEFVYGYVMFTVICGINYVVYKKPARGVVRTGYGLANQNMNLNLANRPLNHLRPTYFLYQNAHTSSHLHFDILAISVSGVHLHYMLQGI